MPGSHKGACHCQPLCPGTLVCLQCVAPPDPARDTARQEIKGLDGKQEFDPIMCFKPLKFVCESYILEVTHIAVSCLSEMMEKGFLKVPNRFPPIFTVAQ